MTKRRHTQRHGRALKAERYKSHLAEAEQAAQHSDLSRMYHVVRSLTGQLKRDRPQLRGPDGSLLNRSEELEALRTHFTRVWGAEPGWEPPRLQSSAAIPPMVGSGWQLETGPTAPQICKALQGIRPTKAVPSHLAPGGVWRLCAAPFAEIAHDMLQSQ